MVYAQTATFGFVYEDLRHDAEPLVLLSGSWAVWHPRAVTTLTYALTSRWWNASPAAAHTVSVAWHLLNGLLLWRVARRVITPAAAVVAVGLFWLLPVQTEAVAGIAYRSELVAASALLVALWCAQRGWMVAAFVCALAAVTGKEMGVMAVALVPIWIAWHQLPVWTPRTAVCWAIGGLGVTAAVLGHTQGYAWRAPVALIEELSAAIYLGMQVVVPVRLTIDHDWARLTPWASAAALVFVAALLEIAWRRRARAFPMVLAWSVVAWLPHLLWNLGEGFHEHHLYTPLMAGSVAMGAALFPRETHATRL